MFGALAKVKLDDKQHPVLASFFLKTTTNLYQDTSLMACSPKYMLCLVPITLQLSTPPTTTVKCIA
jgi:hypothetical protein